MRYLIVEDGLITNIIVADADFATMIGALPWYDTAQIGNKYDPYGVIALQNENDNLKSQLTTLEGTMNDLMMNILPSIATTT